jgi:hypothetical protein
VRVSGGVAVVVVAGVAAGVVVVVLAGVVVVLEGVVAVTLVAVEELVVVREVELLAVRVVRRPAPREVLVRVARVRVVLVLGASAGVVAVGVELAVLCVPVDPPLPPHAASASAAAQGTIAAVARRNLIGACDGCHSQSARATDIVRRDGSESDVP